MNASRGVTATVASKTDQLAKSGSRGRLEPDPTEPRSWRLHAAAVITALAIGIAATIYYSKFAAPYESTDDAFIDGDVTLLSPRVSGQISSLLVTDNQEVKSGDIMAEIDGRDYETKLALARADLALAGSQLEQAQAQTKVSQAKVVQTQAAVTAAEAENDRTAADLKRYESVESRAVSKSAFDQARTQARAANANLEAARGQAKAAEAEVTLSTAGIEMANAAVQQAQAKLAQAELNLSYTKITAPCDGRVTARAVQVGNYVQPGQILLTLVPRDVWVVANFKERQLARLHPGQTVELQIDAYASRRFKGRVDSLQAGSGARFSMLPPENAVGNYVKVVQRVPVKIVFAEPLPADIDIAPGMSVVPSVRIR